jgi:hypothetical protein
VSINVQINYLSVVVAAIVAMVIGFIWYAPPVFGKRWMAYLGTTQAQLGNPGGMGIAIGAVASLLNAWALAVIAYNVKATDLSDALKLGGLCWLGFMATITAAQISFEKKSWGLWLLNNGHNVIVQVVMAAIVTLWPR